MKTVQRKPVMSETHDRDGEGEAIFHLEKNSRPGGQFFRLQQLNTVPVRSGSLWLQIVFP